jgi:hypothetical protein
LRREFVDLSFKPEESVEDFSLDLNTVASQLQVLGDEMADKEVIKKMLHAIPDKLVHQGGHWSPPCRGTEKEADTHKGQRRPLAPHRGGVDGSHEVA